MGTVLFVGRYFATHTHLLFKPTNIEADVLSITDYKDRLKLSYVRPLVFFALSAFIAIAFSQKALGGIAYVEWIFDRYPFLSSSVNTKIDKFSLAKSLALMIPLIFVVSFYANISLKVFSRLGIDTFFKQHLSICAYISGSLLLAESFASNFEMHLWGEPGVENWFDDSLRPVIGIIGMLLGAGWGALALYRHFYFYKRTFKLKNWQSVLYPTLCFIVFWVLFGVLLFSIDPFLQSLD
jgi:hypothetical protein